MVDKAHRGGEPRLGARWAPILGTSCGDSPPSDLCCYRCLANPRTVVAVALCRCTAPRLAVLLGTSSETETHPLNHYRHACPFISIVIAIISTDLRFERVKKRKSRIEMQQRRKRIVQFDMKENFS